MLLLTLILLFFAQFSFASSLKPPAIDAENYSRLQPVQRIEFADLNADFHSGWFVMNADGTRFFILDAERTGYVIDDTGDVLWSLDLRQSAAELGFVIDGVFAPDNEALVLLVDAWFLVFDLKDGEYFWFAQDADARALALWMDEEQIWTEALGLRDGGTIIQRYTGLGMQEVKLLETLEYPPGQEASAVVRIGRIPLPYVVTSSLSGEVMLWDIRFSEPLLRVENGAAEPSVFGNINHSATHLVWRDNTNQTLYLLDFASGESIVLDALDGDYVQWFFLSQRADLALGVQIGATSHIYAWNPAIPGIRSDLGAFRECGRAQPDMARLSADGTTLVIGCPLGLEIWRVR